jgi:hypothetical protein
LSESTPRKGQQSISVVALAAGKFQRLQAGAEPVENCRSLAEYGVHLDQFRVRRNQAADAIPDHGQFLQRPVVLIEREYAVVGFAQCLAVYRREVFHSNRGLSLSDRF